MRVCFVTANSFALNAFLAAPIRELANQGWDVTVLVNLDGGPASAAVLSHARVLHVGHRRDISPWADLRSLWTLWRLFRRERYDVVHSVTPKAGLLAMLAARIAGVPRRIHTFTGQVWATRSGLMRTVLKSVDRCFAACATDVLADSASQRDFMAREGIAPLSRIRVLASGSICGVDTGAFQPDSASGRRFRDALGVEPETPLVVYVGRVHPDKGMSELGAAIREVARRHQDVQLVLVGPDEGGLRSLLANAAAAKVHVLGRVDDPRPAMAAADVFCLPSYREGFGLSLIEAAAMGLPAVATRIYGITDAVVDGVTGILVPARDSAALAVALERLVGNGDLRRRLGQAARERAVTAFSQPVVLQAWLALYAERPKGQK